MVLYRKPGRASDQRHLSVTGARPLDPFPQQFAIEHHRRVVVAFNRLEVGANNSPPRCSRASHLALSSVLNRQYLLRKTLIVHQSTYSQQFLDLLTFTPPAEVRDGDVAVLWIVDTEHVAHASVLPRVEELSFGCGRSPCLRSVEESKYCCHFEDLTLCRRRTSFPLYKRGAYR